LALIWRIFWRNCRTEYSAIVAQAVQVMTLGSYPAVNGEEAFAA
jgi:hypothetical protein